MPERAVGCGLLAWFRAHPHPTDLIDMATATYPFTVEHQDRLEKASSPASASPRAPDRAPAGFEMVDSPSEPAYNLSVQVKLYNTLTGMVLVYTAWNIPLVVWLLKGFFDAIPRAWSAVAMLKSSATAITKSQASEASWR